jgi:hypothetical protein
LAPPFFWSTSLPMLVVCLPCVSLSPLRLPGTAAQKRGRTHFPTRFPYSKLWYCPYLNHPLPPTSDLHIPERQQPTTMEHLKALLSTSSGGPTVTPSPIAPSRRLRATLSSVSRAIKSNFVDTLARKAVKRASSPSPLMSTPPPSKRLRSLVTPALGSFSTPSSSVSSLTFSSHGSYKHGTNQAITEVLYGDGLTPTSIEFSTSRMTSNTGLRRLLVPEVLQLQEQSKLVLVLSMTSHLLPLFKGVVLQDLRQNYRSLLPTARLQLANETLQKRHEFQRLGKPFIEFRVVLVSYPKRHLLYDDAIDAATLRLWLSQGEGFKVEFLDYRGQTLLVKWKDLQDATALEIWRPSTRDDKLTPVSFGRPRSMESKCNLLEESLCAVSGDLTQTLYILLEYYKTESSMYRRRASEVIAQKTKTTILKADGYLDELRMEIQSSALELFVTKVDDLYKEAIHQHYNSFHFINEPLLPPTTKANLFDILSLRFPMHCSVLESICTTDRNLRTHHPCTVSKKQNVIGDRYPLCLHQ